ncbi:hypothetical protein [Campylobacter coli]|uniref:hypothetical protein n=1 Tax=Campylobacter coli TaxID=195 RepID=UPI0037BE75F8
MTEIQFNEIKERLTQWRQERHLTYENQQAEFLGNVFEKVSEYFRAKDDLERVKALCDIAVFCFNVNDVKFSNYECYMKSDKVDFEIFDIASQINSIAIYKANFEIDSVKVILDTLIALLHKKCEILKFDFYKCMLEKIKEIESRTGFYDDELNKFIKDEGYYDITHLKNEIKLPKTYEIINMIEEKDLFLVKIKTPNTILTNKFKKWYKADYESCRL